MRRLVVLGWLGLGAAAFGQGPTEFAVDRPPDVKHPVSLYAPAQLLRMKESQLLELYKDAEPGEVPSGYVPGLVIFKPGSCLTIPIAKIAKATVWQGKIFHADGHMYNRTFGLPAVRTPIELGTSCVDGRPSLILDYAENRLWYAVVHKFRDEVREVSPGIYLGMMIRRDADVPKIATWFALDARSGKGCVLPGK